MASTWVFGLTVLISVFVVLLAAVVIAVAIFFQKIRRKIEAEISNSHEPVAKMTVKKRKKQNKYSTNTKRHNDREPSFYESPTMSDEQKDLMQMRFLQRQQENSGSAREELSIPGQQESYIECIRDDEYDGCKRDRVTQDPVSRNLNRHSKAMPRSSGSDDSYIECIRDDEPSQRMTTFQNPKVSATLGRVTQQVSHNTNRHCKTMPRSSGSDDSYIECIREEQLDGKLTTPSRGVTLPMDTSTPVKKKSGRGFKGSSDDIVTQQQVSRNTNRRIPSGESSFGLPATRAKIKDPGLNDADQKYEVMGQTDEMGAFYENTGFTNDSNEDVYGNQEIIEKEKRKRSQDNTRNPLQEHATTWNAHNRIKSDKHQDSCDEEIYENQEIVNRERNKRKKHDVTYNKSDVNRGHVANGQSNLSMDMNSIANSSDTGGEHLELYENYVEEDMYENC